MLDLRSKKEESEDVARDEEGILDEGTGAEEDAKLEDGCDCCQDEELLVQAGTRNGGRVL